MDHFPTKDQWEFDQFQKMRNDIGSRPAGDDKELTITATNFNAAVKNAADRAETGGEGLSPYRGMRRRRETTNASLSPIVKKDSRKKGTKKNSAVKDVENVKDENFDAVSREDVHLEDEEAVLNPKTPEWKGEGDTSIQSHILSRHINWGQGIIQS